MAECASRDLLNVYRVTPRDTKTHLMLRTEFNKDPFTGLLTLDLEANLERVGAEQLRWISKLYRSALASVAADEYAVPTQRALLGERQWQELRAGSRGPHQPLACRRVL